MRNSNLKNIFLIFLFMFLCASCQTESNFTELTITNTPEIYVNKNTPLPTPTKWPTHTPAPTRKPTLQPTITLTPNPTWVAIQNTDSNRVDLTQTASSFLKTTNPIFENCFSILSSLNNKKIACTTSDGVVIYDGSIKKTTISPKDISIEEPPFGEMFIEPIQWSKDNINFYFTISVCCMTGPSFLQKQPSSRLWKINTNNFIITDILSLVDEVNSPNYISISPMENYLIYISDVEGLYNVNIQSLNNNSVQKVSLPNKFYNAGYALWSDDESQVVFSAISGDYTPFTPEARISLMLLDINSFELKELIIDSTQMLKPIEWDNNNIITIRAESGIDYGPTDGAYWYYDLNANMLSTEGP